MATGIPRKVSSLFIYYAKIIGQNLLGILYIFFCIDVPKEMFIYLMFDKFIGFFRYRYALKSSENEFLIWSIINSAVAVTAPQTGTNIQSR